MQKFCINGQNTGVGSLITASQRVRHQFDPAALRRSKMAKGWLQVLFWVPQLEHRCRSNTFSSCGESCSCLSWCWNYITVCTQVQREVGEKDAQALLCSYVAAATLRYQHDWLSWMYIKHKTGNVICVICMILLRPDATGGTLKLPVEVPGTTHGIFSRGLFICHTETMKQQGNNNHLLLLYVWGTTIILWLRRLTDIVSYVGDVLPVNISKTERHKYDQ